MERISGERAGETQSIRQVVMACFIGTTLEWYEFFLYAGLGALLLAGLFLPSADPLVGMVLLLTGVAASGARLLGGMIFGHYGDRIGRKPMLVISLMLMGIPTFVIGLLPTFESIGIWTAVLLMVLRVTQGLSLGGEWGGAVLLTVEHSPEDRRGFYGSWLQTGIIAGLVLANATLFLLLSLLPREPLVAWGWRIPYLASIILVGVGLFMRLKVMESPTFRQVQETQTAGLKPIMDVLRYDLKKVLLVTGMRIAEVGIFFILTIFVLVYVSRVLGLSQSTSGHSLIASADGRCTCSARCSHCCFPSPSTGS